MYDGTIIIYFFFLQEICNGFEFFLLNEKNTNILIWIPSPTFHNQTPFITANWVICCIYSHISKEAVRSIHNYVYWIVSAIASNATPEEWRKRTVYTVFCDVCLPIFPISSTSHLHLIKMASPTNYLHVIISFVFWFWHWNMFGSRKFECLADLLRSHRCSKNWK